MYFSILETLLAQATDATNQMASQAAELTKSYKRELLMKLKIEVDRKQLIVTFWCGPATITVIAMHTMSHK